MYVPLNENFMLLTSGTSSKFNILNGFYILFITPPQSSYRVIVARIKQVYLLHHATALRTPPFEQRDLLLLLLLLFVFDVDAGEDVAGVVEAGAAGLADADEALLLLVLPDARGAVLRAGDEGRVQGVQVQVGDGVSVAHEGAEDVVVVEGPVHDAD